MTSIRVWLLGGGWIFPVGEWGGGPGGGVAWLGHGCLASGYKWYVITALGVWPWEGWGGREGGVG